MAIDFDAIRRAALGNQAAPTAKEERPKAKHWLNLGVQVGDKFVSLPRGVALDDMEHQPATSKNEDFRALRLAQNDLLDQVKKLAATLKPGQELFIPLQIQLRMVDDPSTLPAIKENAYQVDLLGAMQQLASNE